MIMARLFEKGFPVIKTFLFAGTARRSVMTMFDELLFWPTWSMMVKVPEAEIVGPVNNCIAEALACPM